MLLIVAGLAFFGYKMLVGRDPPRPGEVRSLQLRTPPGPRRPPGHPWSPSRNTVPAQKLPPSKASAATSGTGQEDRRVPDQRGSGCHRGRQSRLAPNPTACSTRSTGSWSTSSWDDAVQARDAYASGQSHVLWGTLTYGPFLGGAGQDSRTALRIFSRWTGPPGDGSSCARPSRACAT